MEKYWYLFGGLLIGFLICYLICKDNDGGSAFECPDEHNVVQYCLDTIVLDTNSVATIDATLIEHYKEAFLAGDSIGFSLDRALVLGLAAYLNIDPQSHGVRLYPGHNGTNKLVLIKPLDDQGNERSNIGNFLNVTGGLNGPCPKWCGLEGRIILPPSN